MVSLASFLDTKNEKLLSDTSGDGTGCDNMTGIIVQLNPRAKVSKRPHSDGDEAPEDKKPKVE